MNYEPNTIRWQPGDLVIHDADAKNRHMLMVVLGHDSRGDVQTIYLHQGKCAEYRQTPRGLELRAKIWTNPGSVLHDPARFGIELPPVRLRKSSAEGTVPKEDFDRLLEINRRLQLKILEFNIQVLNGELFDKSHMPEWKGD